MAAWNELLKLRLHKRVKPALCLLNCSAAPIMPCSQKACKTIACNERTNDMHTAYYRFATVYQSITPQCRQPHIWRTKQFSKYPFSLRFEFPLCSCKKPTGRFMVPLCKSSALCARYLLETRLYERARFYHVSVCSCSSARVAQTQHARVNTA